MIKTTMKTVEQFDSPPAPGEIASVLEALESKCYSAFGSGGELGTLILENRPGGGKTFVAIVEVEG